MIKVEYLGPDALSEDYQFDPTKLDFNNGAPVLKANRPAQLSFLSQFDTIDANYSREGGSLVATPSGGITVVNRELVLGQNKYLAYTGAGNFNSAVMTGCIEFVWKPDAAGAPLINSYWFYLMNAFGDYKNLIGLHHRTDGYILIQMADNGNNLFLNAGQFLFLPLANSKNYFSLNWDLDQNIVQLYHNGTLVSDHVVVGTRTNNIGIIRINNVYIDGFAELQGRMSQLQLYDTVQRTGNYTPVDFLDYLTATISSVATITTPQILQILASYDLQSGTSIKIVLQVDGQYKYYDGTDWANSSGPLESNLVSELTSEVLSLLTLDNNAVRLKFYLITDGIVTPQLNNYSATVHNYQTASLRGFYLNPDTSPVETQRIVAIPKKFNELPSNIQVNVSNVEAEPDPDFVNGWIIPKLIVGVTYYLNFIDNGKFIARIEKTIDQAGDLNSADV